MGHSQSTEPLNVAHATNMGKYEPDYSNIKSADGWIGPKNSYVQEFFGTIFWLFLASQVQVFGLGVGFQFGVAWVIATSMFSGHFNAMTTLLKMILGGDPLDGVIRLLVQVLAGFMGYSLFSYLGYSNWDMFSADNLALHKMITEGEGENAVSSYDTSGLWAWLRLFLTLCVYFATASRLNLGDNMQWLNTILLLGVTFAIGGADFAFAPNRYWFCLYGDWVSQATVVGWSYLAYAVCGFAAKYVLDLYDGDTTFNWGLPELSD